MCYITKICIINCLLCSQKINILNKSLFHKDLGLKYPMQFLLINFKLYFYF